MKPAFVASLTNITAARVAPTSRATRDTRVMPHPKTKPRTASSSSSSPSSPSPSPTSSSSASKTARTPRSTTAKTTRRRVRASGLARKYRTASNEDHIMVGHPTPSTPQPSQQSFAADSIVALAQKSSSSAAAVSASASAASSFALAAASATAALPSAAATAPQTHSRFPTSWTDALTQVCTSVSKALLHGHDRVRVELRAPEFAASSAQDDTRVRMLAEAASELHHTLTSGKVQLANGRANSFKPTGTVLLFDTPADADCARPVVAERAPDAEVASLCDLDSVRDLAVKLVIVVAPSNKRGNPVHIEAVQRVHYSNWTAPNWVVVINPDLIALTNFHSLDDCPRPPCFLTDYLLAYYLNPSAYPADVATGAVLRCFPRKWELYLRKASADHGFRLISEQRSEPSPENLRCEFSWRIEREAQQYSRAQLV